VGGAVGRSTAAVAYALICGLSVSLFLFLPPPCSANSAAPRETTSLSVKIAHFVHSHACEMHKTCHKVTGTYRESAIWGLAWNLRLSMESAK